MEAVFAAVLSGGCDDGGGDAGGGGGGGGGAAVLALDEVVDAAEVVVRRRHALPAAAHPAQLQRALEALDALRVRGRGDLKDYIVLYYII